jgi:Asp-tRNA(Asn)/Glu-tRNA(Gln) amidotransferase A subunit family amidase
MSLSIRDIQQGLRSKTFSARELAQQSLALIEQANPGINAFTGVTATRMLTEAAHIDARRAAGETLPALAGVPYAVKNLFDVEGLPRWRGQSCSALSPRNKRCIRHSPAYECGCNAGWHAQHGCLCLWLHYRKQPLWCDA